jgi:uncharacterized protein YbjT (DUF2867 family)
MIVVFGASGKTGGAAVQELRRRGVPVRGVVRDAAKSGTREEAVADLYDARAVRDAIAGADGVLVICPPRVSAADVLSDALTMVENLTAAIELVRPRAVVAVSDYGAQHASGTGVTVLFNRLEARMRSLPVSMTFLRSAEHMENWARQIGVARARGVLPSLHHPITKIFPTVSSGDVGLVAADLLTRPADHRGNPRVIHVEGPRRYTAGDVADAMARLLGRPVVAQALPREQWASVLVSAGLGPDYARRIVELQDAHNAGHIDVEPGGEVRRGTTDLETALAALVAPQPER